LLLLAQPFSDWYWPFYWLVLVVHWLVVSVVSWSSASIDMGAMLKQTGEHSSAVWYHSSIDCIIITSTAGIPFFVC
jgi:hypothetical protein